MRAGLKSQISNLRFQNGFVMKFEILNLKWAAVVFVVCIASVQGETGATSRVGTIDKTPRLVVPLPPLAVLETRNESGRTWRQSGTLGGSIESVRADFECALRGAKWRRDKVIALGRAGRRSELITWESGRLRILMMLWEQEAGVCGFAWGEEK